MWRLEPSRENDQAIHRFSEDFGATTAYRDFVQRTVRDRVVDAMRHRATGAIIVALIALGSIGWAWTFVISA